MNTDTPETDDAARKGAYFTLDKYPETCGKQIVHIEFARKLERERNALQRWKDEAISVENDWQPQHLAALLNMPLGASIRKHLMSEVPKLIAERDALRAENNRMKLALVKFLKPFLRMTRNKICELLNHVLKNNN